MPELSGDDVRQIAEALTLSSSTPARAPALASDTSTPGDVIEDVESDATARGLRFPPGLIERTIAALAHSNVRLMGAPGTGKSTFAEMILRARKGDDWIFALATGQWTGEDVIGGPVPDPSDPRKLVFQPGLVLAAADAGRWVGIDEINRADIDAAFGEFFSLLAGFDTTLPYPPNAGSDKRVKIHAERPTGELEEGEYGLPPDWRMIATMNSWDKASLARVSFAFSRRWCTIYVPVPDSATYDSILNDALSNHPAASVTAVEEALKLLFVEDASEPVPTLRRLGLALGPGIAISCVKDIAACVDLGLAPAAATVAALEGFVLPQFEGQLELHDEIRAALFAIVDRVEASDEAKRVLGERLELFTGKRASMIF